MLKDQEEKLLSYISNIISLDVIRITYVTHNMKNSSGGKTN